MSASALSPQAAHPQRRALAFGPFVLDPVAAELRSPDGPVALRPRAFDLLCALARRAGELVTKDELLDTVWGTRFVTEGVIKTAIADLRNALGDDPKAPRWIQTVARRGYRFVADADAPGPMPVPAPLPTPVEPAATRDDAALVGRDEALAALERHWRELQRGQRRLVFIAGDPGVGKSALAAAFVERLAEACVAHGQCVEAFGQGEPYLPWFEVLASLHAEVDDLPQLLRRVAPAWLAQMPWLQTEAERAAPPDAGAGERMPRQMAELLEQLAQRAPLVLVLEDLHWSDHASVHLLEHLARRRAPARLMVLATFRATELVLAEHPLADLRRELRLHALVHEITLDGLDADATRALLAAWHPGAGFGRMALQALHDHTDGVPLFLRAVLDALVADGVLAEADDGRWRLAAELPEPLPLPERLAGLYEHQLQRLTGAERELLEAAAVAGVSFDAAVLAAALEQDVAAVHERCDGLVRRGRWLQAAGLSTPPDAEPAGRYRFGHALMHALVYGRCSALRRVQLHGRVAAALAARHGERADEAALERAFHHEQALEPARALPLLAHATRQAAQRFAGREVLDLATRALALLPACTGRVDTSQLDAWRRELLSSRASALSFVDGPGSAAHQQAIAEALQAHQGQPMGLVLLNLMRVQWLHLVVGGRFADALALAEDAVRRADASSDAALRVAALSMLHFSAFKCGAFGRARHAIARAGQEAADIGAVSEGFARFFRQQAHERRLLGALMDTLQGCEPASSLDAVIDFPADAYSGTGRALNGLLAQLCLAWRGDAAAVRAGALAMAAWVERHQVEAPVVMAHRVLAYWADGVLNDAAAALPPLRAALADVLRSPHVAERAALHALAAELTLRAGRPDEAEAELRRAFEHVERTGERYVLARLWALRRALAQALGDCAAADAAAAAEASALDELGRA